MNRIYLFSLLIAALLLGQITAQADITTPGDTVRGVPNDGDWPANESPPLAIDDDVTTKFLHFKGDAQSTGFQVTPSAGESIVTGLTFTTANDAPERDPTAFSLFGSNVSIDGPYTLITDGDIVDFSQATAWPRLTKNSTPIAFDNKTAYAHYLLVFRVIRDAGRANSMQIAEVEFMASPVGGLPPEVDAGDDQTITWKGVRNTIIDLYPTIYDDDPCDIGQTNPDYLTIYWSSLGQPSADFMGTENEPNAVVMFPEPGVYELQLQVWDERGQEGKDIIIITVVEPVCPLGDLSGDCKVNFSDLMAFVEQWLDPPGCSDYPFGCADLAGNDGVNLVDFALITGGWLKDWNGFLRINISPPEVVTEGARWRSNGGTWQDSGELVNNLTPGSHTVEFSTVDNWIRPPSRTVQIQKNQITTITAMYTQPPDSPILINEIMALNGSKPPLDEGDILDEDGDSSDWIEIHNSTEAAISLKGWYLTNDAGDMRQWELPSVQIGPGEFKIIFASGKDRDDPDDELHTNFRLTGSAAFVALVKPDGETIAHVYEYPQQFGDLSYGLSSSAAGLATDTTLIKEFAPATAMIPTDGSLGLSWTEPGFDDPQWLKGTTGVGYDYGSLIGLDVREMRNVNQTVYVRILFTVEDVSAIDELTLRMKYEDDFVAYLNGHELGRDNAPGLNQLTWNSGATTNRSDSLAVVFQDFDISAYKDFLVVGNNVLAIHGLNNGVGSSDLLILPEMIATELKSIDISSMVEGYFNDPTPGKRNGSVIANLGPTIRNVTENPQQPTNDESLIITAYVTETFDPVAAVMLVYRVNFDPEASIKMFDDGLHSDGMANDRIYGGVIPSSAYGPGDMVRWKVVSFDIEGITSNNPAFLITEGRIQSPEYFGTVVVNPSINTALPIFQYFVQNIGAAGGRAGTRSSVFYLDEFYDNVFIRLRGGFTTHGRKFEFNDGHHFRFDPGIPRVDEINLNERGADPSYIRQVLGWETYFNAGQPGSLSFPMHVRRNGSFLAVRIFIEQPDRDLLRRNDLNPDGALYKMYDDLQNGQIDGEGVHRKKTRLDEDSGDLLALAGGIDTRNPNRNTFLFDNVNIPAMINYWASSVIMHENDHTHKNYYAYRDTLDPVNNPDGTNEWMFLPWDKDLTFGINNGIGGVIADQDWPGDVRSPSHPFFGCSEHQKIDRQWNCLIDALHDNPVTRQMYLRRLRMLMDDLLQPPGTPVAELKFEKRIDELQAQLDIELGGTSFYNNLNLIKTNYLAVRRQHLFNNHSIHNPGFDQNAGIPDAQPAGVIINFGSVEFNPASGNQDQEYIELINPAPFAVDISGWSMEDGVEHIFPLGTVIPAYGSLYVTPNAVAFRNRTTSPKGGEQLFVQGNYKGHLSSWGETINLIDGDGTLVNTVTYPGDPSDQQAYLRITEVMYNPAEGGTFDNKDYEYIELKNIGDTALLLDGVRFTEGIAFDFPSISLPAGDYVLVAKNQAAFASRYVVSGDVQVLGPYDGHLSNSGEDVKLEDFTNSTILEFKYRDGWYDITDGMGFSLTVNDPVNTDPNAWGDKSSWRPSSEIGGSPGWDDTGDVPEIGDVVINELLAHSHAIAPDWIELHNTTDQPINIGGWFLSDDSNDLTKYEVDVGTTIEPYGYVVFYEDQHFGNSADPGCNVPFALSENGEVLYLHSGRNSVITGYSQEESFGASETGIAFGLYQKSTGSYNFVAMSENTPGVANTYPMVGPVVISEIMYHPDLDGDAEYVELVNISDLPVSLYYDDPITTTVEPWRFTDDPDEPGIELFFPTDIPVVLDPGEYILLVKKLSSFNSRYPAPPGVQIFEWVDGKLDNAGEKVQLSKPGDVDLQGRRQWIRVDRVVYSDGSHSDDFADGIDPWPIEADGQGLSLSRIDLEAYGNDPANWQAAAPSPGVANK